MGGSRAAVIAGASSLPSVCTQTWRTPLSGWSQASRFPSGESVGRVRSGFPKSASRGISGVSARAPRARTRTARASRRTGGRGMVRSLPQERHWRGPAASWQGNEPRVRSPPLRWGPAWFLVAGALPALGPRFLDREHVSYVLDEPQLQDAAVRDARAGHWASISVLRGTRGVRYGP